MEREDSVYHWYQDLLALRKNPEYKEAVVYGELIPYLREQKNLMAYYRKSEEKTLLVAANYQAEPQVMQLPGEVKHVLMNNAGAYECCDGRLTLEGYQVVILEMNK